MCEVTELLVDILANVRAIDEPDRERASPLEAAHVGKGVVLRSAASFAWCSPFRRHREVSGDEIGFSTQWMNHATRCALSRRVIAMGIEYAKPGAVYAFRLEPRAESQALYTRVPQLPQLMPLGLRKATTCRRSLVRVLSFVAPALISCDYVRLLRPSVLEQLRPPMVRLVNFLPELDEQNRATVGRLFATGGLSEATVGADGLMRSAIRIRKDQLIYEPSIVVMPNAGELELTVTNEDEAVHVLYLPSNAQRQVLVLLSQKAGTARLRLDAPGLYTIACPVGNHAGRGELGVIIVRGETPSSGRLERPPQPRPRH